MSAGRSATVAASKPWTTVSLRTLDLQNRAPGDGGEGQLPSSDHVIADEFMKIVPVPVVVRSDHELVRGTFPGPVARGGPFGPA